MFNTKPLIAALLLSCIACLSAAQATSDGANKRTGAATAAEASSTKAKPHKAKPQAKKKNNAKSRAVKAKTKQAAGKSKSKGPGLEAY